MKEVLLLFQEKIEPSKRYRRASGHITLARLFRAQVRRFHLRWSPSAYGGALQLTVEPFSLRWSPSAYGGALQLTVEFFCRVFISLSGAEEGRVRPDRRVHLWPEFAISLVSRRWN